MDTELQQWLDLATAQAKRVEREARQLKQMVANIRDLSTANMAQGEANAASQEERS